MNIETATTDSGSKLGRSTGRPDYLANSDGYQLYLSCHCGVCFIIVYLTGDCPIRCHLLERSRLEDGGVVRGTGDGGLRGWCG